MGRNISGNARKYQIREVQEWHHQILRLAVLGYRPSDVADILGCTTATVSNVINSELGKRQLMVMRGAADATAVDVMAEIKRLSPVALQRLEEIITTPDVPVKLVADVAMDLLDRAGYGAPKVIQGQFTHAHLTKEDIEDLKRRADADSVEACIEAGKNEVIEGELL